MYHGYCLLEYIERMVSALDYDQDFSGVMNCGVNYDYMTKIKVTNTTGKDIVVSPKKKMMAKNL